MNTTDLNIARVREFHAAFGVIEHTDPRKTDKATRRLRYSLLKEELHEFYLAQIADDPVAMLDALCDLQYVLDGTFLALGLADVKEPAMNEVHRSNMSKLDKDGKPIRRQDGKILKGHQYFPPDLAQFISL